MRDRTEIVNRDEYIALKQLARWVRKNTEGRSRPSQALVDLLNRLAITQGERPLWSQTKEETK